MKSQYYKMILIVLFVTVIAQTAVYKNFGNSNTNYRYFDDRTFGYKIYDDPCVKIKYTYQYRNYVNNHMKCIGTWCKNNMFSCGNERKNCYHVEHIIDSNGPEYTKECKNIVGNLVMSYDKWNEGLGGIARNNYELAQREKMLIYGTETVRNIKKIIERCCGIAQISQPIEKPNEKPIEEQIKKPNEKPIEAPIEAPIEEQIDITENHFKRNTSNMFTKEYVCKLLLLLFVLCVLDVVIYSVITAYYSRDISMV